jgi:DNA-binding NarL/FixJ family response regulator
MRVTTADHATDAIRVLLVDDDALIRAGLTTVVASDDALVVVGEAADGHDAISKARSLAPDVVVMDVRMPRLDGIAATAHIAAGDDPPRVLVLTTFELDVYVVGALRAGASGFMLKRSSPEALIEAIKVIAHGETLLAPTVLQRLLDTFVTPDPASPHRRAVERLTDREREVLVHVAAGRSNDEIAAALVVSTETVKTHLKRMYAKLGVRDRAQAVVMAYESGAVRPGT